VGWTDSWLGRIIAGVFGLLASILVSFLYHLGYSEFRNRTIGSVLVGNSLITLAYLVTRNPLASMMSHIVMHVAAVLRGPETVIQLPPHHPPIRQRTA
jgi:hypothetical protein